MKTTYLVSGLLATLLLPVSLDSVAQAVDVSSCQKIEDRLARYACYDGVDPQGTVAPRREAAPASAPRTASSTSTSAQTARVVETPKDEPSLLGRLFNRGDDDEQQEAAPAVQAAASSEPEDSTVANFGRSNTADAQVREGDDGRTELVDTVAAVENFGPQILSITLESGQQWRQMLSKRYNLKAGDEVRIYPSMWGSSYRLSTERLGGYIQVERID